MQSLIQLAEVNDVPGIGKPVEYVVLHVQWHITEVKPIAKLLIKEPKKWEMMKPLEQYSPTKRGIPTMLPYRVDVQIHQLLLPGEDSLQATNPDVDISY